MQSQSGFWASFNRLPAFVRVVLIIIAGVVTLSIVGALIPDAPGEEDVTAQTSGEGQAAVAVAKTAKPVPSPKQTPMLPTVGQSVLLSKDGWILTVTSVRKAPTARVALQGTKTALGIYVQVELQMENTGKEAKTLGGDRFELRDDLGRKYPVYVKGGEVGSRINPGLKAKGNVVFDVPRDARGLVLHSLGGFRTTLGNTADIEEQPLQ